MGKGRGSGSTLCLEDLASFGLKRTSHDAPLNCVVKEGGNGGDRGNEIRQHEKELGFATLVIPSTLCALVTTSK